MYLYFYLFFILYVYFVLGGTVDITVHQTLETGQVKELYKATGGAWGGTFVDAAFEDMLKTIFGDDFINHFKEKHPSQWLEMMTQFEKRKRPVEPGGSTYISIPLSYVFVEQYKEFYNKEIRCAFTENQVAGVEFTNGTIRISSAKNDELFNGVLCKIKDHIQSLLQNQIVSDVKYIFLVGGFGESKYLQHMIQEQFGQGRSILIPEEASMCVLKGAVRYGHSPDAIASRISKFTYAVAKSREFIPGQDNETLMRRNPRTGSQRMSFLRTLVAAGDSVPFGTTVSTTIHPHTDDQVEINCVLYCSDDILSEKAHPSDDNVYKLCKLKIDSPDTSKGRSRKFRIFLSFAGTEMYLIVLEDGSDNEVVAAIEMDW